MVSESMIIRSVPVQGLTISFSNTMGWPFCFWAICFKMQFDSVCASWWHMYSYTATVRASYTNLHILILYVGRFYLTIHSMQHQPQWSAGGRTTFSLQKSSSYKLTEHQPAKTSVAHPAIGSPEKTFNAARDIGTSVGGAGVAGGFFGSANFSLVVYGQSLPSAVRQKPAESLDETTTTWDWASSDEHAGWYVQITFQ